MRTSSLQFASFALSLAASFAVCGAAQAQCEATKPAGKATADELPSVVETAVAAGNFKTLAAALQAAGLIDALAGEGPFTVFAPTDEAFAKLPAGTLDTLLKPENKAMLAGILTYHVVPAELEAKMVAGSSGAVTINGQRLSFASTAAGVMIDKAKVAKADIRCGNGIIHVVDSVMLPASGTVVDQAKGAGTFKTLVTALGAAGLAEALSAAGPFTVFAPTDEAFGKLPKGTVENLLKPENKDQLAKILKLHVVAGRVFSDQAAKLPNAQTLAGMKIEFANKDGLTVNGAKITAANLNASNGVIHVIDTVLLPK